MASNHEHHFILFHSGVVSRGSLATLLVSRTPIENINRSPALDSHITVSSRGDSVKGNPEWVRVAHGEPWEGGCRFSLVSCLVRG